MERMRIVAVQVFDVIPETLQDRQHRGGMWHLGKHNLSRSSRKILKTYHLRRVPRCIPDQIRGVWHDVCALQTARTTRFEYVAFRNPWNHGEGHYVVYPRHHTSKAVSNKGLDEHAGILM